LSRDGVAHVKQVGIDFITFGIFKWISRKKQDILFTAVVGNHREVVVDGNFRLQVDQAVEHHSPCKVVVP
jgi:hypothetical protein